MNCHRHPHKRVVAVCRECGKGFCIECVRETDQTTLCPDCHRLRIDEFSREFASPERAEDAATRAAEAAEGSGHFEGTLEATITPSSRPEMPEGYAKASHVEPEKKEVFPARGTGAGRLWKAIRKGKRPGRARKTSRKESGEEILPLARTAGQIEQEAGEETNILSLGPDEDFSELSKAVEKRGFRLARRGRSEGKGLPKEEILLESEERTSRGAAVVREERAEAPAPEVEEGGDAARPPDGRGMTASAKPGRGSGETRVPGLAYPDRAVRGEEAVLDAVVSRLLRPEGDRREGRPTGGARETSTPAGDGVEEVLSALLKPEEGSPARAREGQRGKAAAPRERFAHARTYSATTEEAAPAVSREERHVAEERRKRRDERERRWSFLAQPRASEHTEIASSWWKAALFISLMLVLGAVLWAVPNTYLVPKDTEYGIHAVAIGILLGLLFWWKAGRKHGTKLAVQAALVTFFALFLGEFLHWFLIITKNAALRTVFFDLISFRFIWEHGAEVMRHTMEAMFPSAFLWIMLMPTLLAFIIGFGMPPIPEIFLQFGRAVRE